eukprot:TRINITY_DN3550_c1_g3_i1.p1 TRINITY_DN3550_c1_g3~~TRINITY_DN3550_c1_g3_i1.p1  ORF type:complete len:300 (+),score=42.51 TRINITY_DN3550_c1_g3_i1:50-949(+)
MMQFVLQNLLLSVTAATIYHVVPLLPGDGDAVFIAKAVVGFCLFRVLNPLVLGRPLFNLFKTEYPDDDRINVRNKFGSHINKVMMHIALQIWGLQVLYNESWFTGWLDWDMCWTGWDPAAGSITGNFRDYYLVEMSFFIGSMVMQFIETRSHDHVAMLGHHYAAATLIAYSYIYNTHRIGMLVLVSRELTDIMIHSARALGLLQFKKMSESLLVLLVLLWVITRCIYHPAVVCLNAWHSPTYEWAFPMWVVYNGLLMALVPLDYYYLYLALAAIVRRIKNPNIKNIDPDTPGFKKQKQS